MKNNKIIENIKLRQLAIEFCDKHTYANEDDIYNFLVDNEWRIYCNYDRNTHKENLIFELSEKNYDTDKIPNNLIDSMVERFEDFLYNDGYRWNTIMNDVIFDYCEDLEEYKVED